MIRTGTEKVNFKGKIFTRYLRTKNPSKINYFYGEVYDRTLRRSKKVALHRYVWEYYNGKISLNCIIYHIDGDPLNNDISNLRCISEYEHLHKYHGCKKYKNAIPRSCECCGETFLAKQKRSRFCVNCSSLSENARAKVKS